jgi:hypothetical protein
VGLERKLTWRRNDSKLATRAGITTVERVQPVKLKEFRAHPAMDAQSSIDPLSHGLPW